jgi:hypothetical protein
MNPAKRSFSGRFLAILVILLSALNAAASEADVKIPNLDQVHFQVFGSSVNGVTLLYGGLVICVL